MAKLTAVKKQDGTVKNYKKMIGRRFFFFGPDKAKAETLADELVATWKAKKARAKREGVNAAWTEAEIANASEQRESAYGRKGSEFDSLNSGALEVARKPQKAPESPKAWEGVTDYEWTVGDAAEAWKRSISSAGISPQERKGLQSRLDNLGEPWDNLHATKMADFGYEEITGVTEFQIREAKEGKQAAQTSKNKLKAFRLFIEYTHRSDRIAWRAFEDWRDYFRNSIKRLSLSLRKQRKQTKRENKLDTKALRKLYQYAPHRVRVYMLLALNTGQINSEIASLRLGMLHLTDDTPTIQRERSKTSVDAKWSLWAETTEALKAAVQQAKREGRTKADDLLFLSQKGKPLVWFDEKDGRVDSITQAWQRLKKRCKLKGKGYAFSLLRKLSSQWIRDNYGRDYSEAFLAHADNSIVDAYNTFNDWEGLYKAINAYREELTEMFKPYTTAEKNKNGIRRTNGAENK